MKKEKLFKSFLDFFSLNIIFVYSDILKIKGSNPFYTHVAGLKMTGLNIIDSSFIGFIKYDCPKFVYHNFIL